MKLDKKKIFLLMARRGFTHQGLAEKVGCARQTLYRLENGGECRPEMLGRIAKALDVDVTEILAD